jgi:agmatinase
MMNLDGLAPWGGLAGATFDAADMVVAGIPYDGSAVYRKGAALAPQRIRSLSAVMPPVTEDGQVLQGLRVHDMGDLDPGPSIAEGWQRVAERLSAVPLTSLLTVLGGDHCTAISTIAAQARRHPDMQLLWVDAHPDLCDFSRGGRWTCGCAMRRALEVSAIDPAMVVIVGARDYDPEEVEFIKATGILLVSARELAAEPADSAEKIADRLAGKKVHVSFDIDALDPAFAPGTEIPSAGGLSTRQALDLVATVLGRTSPVGFDLVEVSPPFDNGDITTLAALKLIFEFWGMSWNGKR